jgi:hypothetical protein
VLRTERRRFRTPKIRTRCGREIPRCAKPLRCFRKFSFLGGFLEPTGGLGRRPADTEEAGAVRNSAYLRLLLCRELHGAARRCTQDGPTDPRRPLPIATSRGHEGNGPHCCQMQASSGERGVAGSSGMPCPSQELMPVRLGPWALPTALKDHELMPQGEDLEVRGGARSEHGDQGSGQATTAALMAATLLTRTSLLNGKGRGRRAHAAAWMEHRTAGEAPR